VRVGAATGLASFERDVRVASDDDWRSHMLTNRFPRLRSALGALRGLCVAGAAAVGLAADAHAYDVNDKIQLHGFITQGYIGTSDNNFLGTSEISAGGNYGTLEYFQAGLNVQAQLLENLRAGMQIFARDVGIYGDYRPSIDWAYLDYKAFDMLGIRAGRVRLPLGFYNEVQDVESSRTAVFLPQTVYPIAFRDFMFVYNGVGLYGTLPLSAAGTVDWDLYGGYTDLGDEDGSIAVAFNSENFKTTEVKNKITLGGALKWNTPVDGLRVGASAVYYEATLDALIATGAPAPAPSQIEYQAELKDVVFAMAGAEYTIGDLVLVGEYARWYGNQEDSFGDESHLLRQHRGYGQASYRFTDWFEAGTYYAIQYSDDSKTRTHDVALSARFDINKYWNVKVEGHYINGTDYLLDQLNEGGTKEEWLMLAITTSVTF